MTRQVNFVSLENPCPSWFRQHSIILLFVIILLAAILRLINLSQSPPGLNQDEAANAWSAYCLLKTGKDYAGVSWPIYYVRNLGGNSTPLAVYMMIPFQAIGGLNVYTTRLPSVFSAIFTVWLIYWIAKKLFDTETGLAAAMLLALNPWHLQQSRWGHEASIAPLLGLIPLAVMLWANLPISHNKNNSPRPVIAGIGGILAGIGCFGYHSVRLFVPVFILAIILFNLPACWNILKTKRGALAVALFFLGFTATFGQLLYLHIFHPEGIGRHATFQPYWVGSASLTESLINVPLRYLQHFGPDFLFIQGDHFEIQKPPVGGQFHWYELPVMIFGAILVLRRFITSASLRTVAAFVLTYPIGDCLGWKLLSIHAMRSSPGLCALVLLSAIGLMIAVRWLQKLNLHIARTAIIVFLASVIGFNARFLYHFYGEFNRRIDIYHLYHVDLIEACNWLKPRLNDFDAVYFTTENLNMPYVITTVAMGYDPQKWFSEPIEIAQTPPEGVYVKPGTLGEWDFYTRYGKMHFIYDYYSTFSIPDLQKNYAPGRLLVVLRPTELVFKTLLDRIKEFEKTSNDAAAIALVQSLNIEKPESSTPKDLAEKIIHKIYDPNGVETLWFFRF